MITPGEMKNRCPIITPPNTYHTMMTHESLKKTCKAKHIEVVKKSKSNTNPPPILTAYELQCVQCEMYEKVQSGELIPGGITIMKEPLQLEDIAVKKCSKCGQEKPLSEFYKDKKAKGGYKPECKQCGYARKKARREAKKIGDIKTKIGTELETMRKEIAILRNAKAEAITSLQEAFDVIEVLKDVVKQCEEDLKKGNITNVPYSTNPAFDAILKQMGEIHDKKRQDYASNDDPLGNFREAEKLGISPLQSIMIRLTDKYTRACNLVRKNGNAAVKNESLADTLLDLANYSVLALLAYREKTVDTAEEHF